MTSGRLLATSDLHVGHPQNRKIVEDMWPESDDDWLLVAGDVGELVSDIEWALKLLSQRFTTVVWVPGNHELWTPREDPVRLQGEQRYHYLVTMCRNLGILTPEDTYPVFDGDGGPARIVPLFLLYDYSFSAPGTTKEESLANAYEAGVVCTDEFLLHPDPYLSRQAWCHARVTETERRLNALDDDIPTVLVNHFPLVREPTRALYYQEFAQWCGTELTADWHRRFRATVMVYGHLHIPRTTFHDGTRFEEVSVGYPREWTRRGHPKGTLRRVLPADGEPQ